MFVLFVDAYCQFELQIPNTFTWYWFFSDCIFTMWRPNNDLVELMTEGNVLKIYHATSSQKLVLLHVHVYTCTCI